MKRPLVFLAVLVVFAAFGALAAPAWAYEPPILRPTEGGEYGYTTSSAPPYVGARAVVHYVTSGEDAPALQDADGSGVPDYVEEVSRAAEHSLDYFARRGFLPPVPDSAGPNANLDIYVVDLDDEGAYGLAIPHDHAGAGGNFFMVDDDLSLSVVDVTGGVHVTLAHELFHMTQFAYFAGHPTPAGTIWADEGTATALSMLAYPEIQDRNNAALLDFWLRSTWLSLYHFDDDLGCLRCYGGAWFWLWLNRVDPDFIREYYGRLYGYTQIGKPLGLGTQPLDELLRRRGYGSLYNAFSTFAVDLYRRNLPITSTYRPQVSYRWRSQVFPKKPHLRTLDKARYVAVVSGLSSHYAPLTVPSGAKGLRVHIENAFGPAPDVALILGGPNGRRVTAKRSLYRVDGEIIRTVDFNVSFRSAKERRQIVLIVTSGRQNGVAYTLDYRAR